MKDHDSSSGAIPILPIQCAAGGGIDLEWIVTVRIFAGPRRRGVHHSRRCDAFGRAGRGLMSVGGMPVAPTSLGGRLMTSARGSGLASSIEDAIDKGATSVEKIHKSLVDLPLRVLEES